MNNSLKQGGLYKLTSISGTGASIITLFNCTFEQFLQSYDLQKIIININDYIIYISCIKNNVVKTHAYSYEHKILYNEKIGYIPQYIFVNINLKKYG